MYIFTDGACTNNGKCNSKASFSVFMDNEIIVGLVHEYEYEYNISLHELSCNSNKIRPSNNRGELLGIIHGLMNIVNKDYNEIILFSDSLISIRTINEWYEKRKKRNTLHEFKNFDLISIMMTLIDIIKNNNIDIKFNHIKAHQKFDKNYTEFEIEKWKGNFLSDLYANKILNNVIFKTEEEIEINKKIIELKITLL